MEHVDLADLHMHSHFSDGQWSPAQLVASAKGHRLRAIALTDHDTVAGIEEAALAGRAAGIEVLVGVEISTWLDADVHLLGYGFDPEHAGVATLLASARTSRAARAELICDRLNEMGVPVSMQEILDQAAGGAIGRPHVARALVEGGHVHSFREAFDVYLGDGKPACVEKARVEPAVAIQVIHEAGGAAVAAHPGFYGGTEFLEPLVAAGLDGVEVRHGLHDEVTAREFEDFARAGGLVCTGGSDFHGPGPGRAGVGTVTIPYEWVEDLLERAAAHRAASGTRRRV